MCVHIIQTTLLCPIQNNNNDKHMTKNVFLPLSVSASYRIWNRQEFPELFFPFSQSNIQNIRRIQM